LSLSGFDAFLAVLEAAVHDLGGDAWFEIARQQGLRSHEPPEALIIAKAAKPEQSSACNLA